MKVRRCELFGAKGGCSGDEVERVEVDAPPCFYDVFDSSNLVEGGTFVDDFQNIKWLYASLIVGSIVTCFALVGWCLIATSRQKNRFNFSVHHTAISAFALLVGVGILVTGFILNSKIRHDFDVRCRQEQYVYERPSGYTNREECASRFWCNGDELSEENASLDHAVSYLFIISAAVAGSLTASLICLSLAICRSLCSDRDLHLSGRGGGMPAVVQVEMPPASQTEALSV